MLFMKDYNHEVKCLNDLRYRYVNIKCHGGYGNDPSIVMLSAVSYIHEGLIKDVDVNYIGEVNGEKQYDNYLIIDSEYGHEIKLPYEKIIGMTILSSEEQANVEKYQRNKDRWENEISHWKGFLNDDNAEMVNLAERMIEAHEMGLKNGEELVAKGIKTYK